jgi:hypothetical protein
MSEADGAIHFQKLQALRALIPHALIMSASSKGAIENQFFKP